MVAGSKGHWSCEGLCRCGIAPGRTFEGLLLGEAHRMNSGRWSGPSHIRDLRGWSSHCPSDRLGRLEVEGSFVSSRIKFRGGNVFTFGEALYFAGCVESGQGRGIAVGAETTLGEDGL